MQTLAPRSCPPSAWRDWCRDGARLVLRSPWLFLAWFGLCLGRGFLLSAVLPGAGFPYAVAWFFATTLPEAVLVWPLPGFLSSRMSPGRGRGAGASFAWLREQFAWASSGGALRRSLFETLLFAGFMAWLTSSGPMLAHPAALGGFSVVVVWGDFFFPLTDTLRALFRLAAQPSERLWRAAFRSNRTALLRMLWTTLAPGAVLALLPLGSGLLDAFTSAAVVWMVLFLAARNTCAVHDIFSTGEKVSEPAPRPSPLRLHQAMSASRQSA